MNKLYMSHVVPRYSRKIVEVVPSIIPQVQISSIIKSGLNMSSFNVQLPTVLQWSRRNVRVNRHRTAGGSDATIYFIYLHRNTVIYYWKIPGISSSCYSAGCDRDNFDVC